MDEIQKKCNISNISNISKIKKIITIENLLCIYLILNPILDIASFLVRNIFETTISPATILRPIIPTIVMIYLFFKNNFKFKLKTIGIGMIYVIYTILHIYMFSLNITNSSFGGITNELQYIINYTFMILNLFIFTHTFKTSNQIEKLKKTMLISGAIYIGSIYISIITGTSSNTYMHEGIGYKGWFESGNSLSAILILLIYTYTSYIKDKKYMKIALPIICLIGIFLIFLIGTRTGMLAFILTIAAYIGIQVAVAVIKKVKVNKKLLGVILVISCLIGIAIGIFGSTTLERREYIDGEETVNYLTGDLTNIKEHIDNNTLDSGFMNEEQKQTIVDLYNSAKEMNIENTDQRMQQLIYNIHLVGNQSNVGMILFGNGINANYRELVLEMEIPALILNFGIIGFIIYMGPFVIITIYGIIKGIKNIKKIDEEYLMILTGIILAYALSILTGYVFFNISAVSIIIVLNTLFIYKVRCFNNEE